MIKCILMFFLLSCSQLKELNTDKKITFFVYSQGLFDAYEKSGDDGVRRKYKELLIHLGNKGKGGEVGTAFVFPYLAWTKGKESGPYKIPKHFFKYYDSFLKVAQELKIPVLVQFNGAVWHSPSSESSFLNYWKTTRNGIYLSRYKDSKVNDSISADKIESGEIEKYLDVGPYSKHSENSLFLTLSPYAHTFRESRLAVLKNAVQYWENQ